MVTINSDLGESIGNHSFGNDDGLLGLVDAANVACGFHAGDPSGIAETVTKAVAGGVAVGAHPGLPDVAGFGRREMAMTREEVRTLVLYQVGALTAFLRAEGAPLSHIKPHGALYGMAGRNEDVMEAICDCAELYGVPVYGMAGTAHESVAGRRGIPLVRELYVDVEYRADGTLIIARRPVPTPVRRAVDTATRALADGTVLAATGETVPVRFDSVCVHSDTPNAVEVAAAVRNVLSRPGS